MFGEETLDVESTAISQMGLGQYQSWLRLRGLLWFNIFLDTVMFREETLAVKSIVNFLLTKFWNILLSHFGLYGKFICGELFRRSPWKRLFQWGIKFYYRCPHLGHTLHLLDRKLLDHLLSTGFVLLRHLLGWRKATVAIIRRESWVEWTGDAQLVTSKFWSADQRFKKKDY